MEVTTAIEGQAADSVMGILAKYRKSLENVLPKHLTKDRFAWLCVNSIRATPALAQCTPLSFINAVMLSANLGLEIRKNSAYLIPYGKECQLIVDYRGKMDLARRAGARSITIELVHAHDKFDYYRSAKGTALEHKPYLLRQERGSWISVDEDERGEVVLGYAMADLGGTEPQIEVMSLAAIEKIRSRAKSGGAHDIEQYGKKYPGLKLSDIRALDMASLPFKHPYRVPWVTDWDQMARKTLAHRICNYLPQSGEVMLSQEIDAAVDTGISMPIAPQLTDLSIHVDPADNKPMVDIPEDPEERKQMQQDIALSKLVDGIRKPADGLGVIGGLFGQLKEHGERGEDLYARVMERNGLQLSPSAKDLTVEKAREVIKGLWAAIELAKQPEAVQ